MCDRAVSASAARLDDGGTASLPRYQRNSKQTSSLSRVQQTLRPGSAPRSADTAAPASSNTSHDGSLDERATRGPRQMMRTNSLPPLRTSSELKQKARHRNQLRGTATTTSDDGDSASDGTAPVHTTKNGPIVGAQLTPKMTSHMPRGNSASVISRSRDSQRNGRRASSASLSKRPSSSGAQTGKQRESSPSPSSSSEIRRGAKSSHDHAATNGNCTESDTSHEESRKHFKKRRPSVEVTSAAVTLHDQRHLDERGSARIKRRQHDSKRRSSRPRDEAGVGRTEGDAALQGYVQTADASQVDISKYYASEDKSVSDDGQALADQTRAATPQRQIRSQGGSKRGKSRKQASFDGADPSEAPSLDRTSDKHRRSRHKQRVSQTEQNSGYEQHDVPVSYNGYSNDGFYDNDYFEPALSPDERRTRQAASANLDFSLALETYRSTDGLDDRAQPDLHDINQYYPKQSVQYSSGNGRARNGYLNSEC